MGPIGALAITRHMVAKLPYDIERDFQPIALVARGHLMLAVSPQAAGDVGRGADRLRQEQSRQADQCLVEQWLARPCRRRAVQIHDRNPDRARALSRRRARDQRSDRRPCRHDVRKPAIDRAVRARRHGARARRQRRQALAGVPGSADHRRDGARLSGADLDRRDRAGRRAARRSSTSSMPRSTRRSCRTAFKEKFAKSSATSRPAVRRRNSPRPSRPIPPNGRDVIKRAGAKLE